jgi:hypothetical protein
MRDLGFKAKMTDFIGLAVRWRSRRAVPGAEPGTGVARSARGRVPEMGGLPGPPAFRAAGNGRLSPGYGRLSPG